MLIQAVDIRRRKSIGKLSIAPFLTLLTNCSVWTLYGLLVGDKTVWVPNAFGILTGMTASQTYTQFSPQPPVKSFAAAITVIAAAIAFSLCGKPDWIALTGCALAVLCAGSPLATLQTVWRDKNTASMPFLTSATFFVNNLSWLLYGALHAKNKFIAYPNGLGLLMASTHMACFLVFGLPPAKPKVQKRTF